MNGGKDVKIGHDKRPISIIPSDEQPLYNIQNGEILTDEFGNPLVTKVDQFFLADASKDRSTSVVFPESSKDKYPIKEVTKVAESTATYGGDFDVDVAIFPNDTFKIKVLRRTGTPNPVGVAITVKERVEPPLVAVGITFTDLNVCEIRTRNSDVGTFIDKNNLYFLNPSAIVNVGIGASFKLSGLNIPDGSFVMRKDYDRIKISEPVTEGVTTDKVSIFNTKDVFYEADNVLKIAEVFKESSEVSTTLLGVNRAETQLSLFSNVSSYGLNNDEWESFSYNMGSSKQSWDERANKIYGNRYLTRIEEETQESAIKLSAFPPPYSYPFGPEWQKVGLYNEDLYNYYKNFIRFGNITYNLFKNKSNYPTSFANKFLNSADVRIDDNNDIFYSKFPDKIGTSQEFAYGFQKIDDWTDTWRAIKERKLVDPTTEKKLGFTEINSLLSDGATEGLIILNETPNFKGDNTSPGYYSNYRRYSAIQSRRVFRYQPGRISGFTFGLRSSNESITGVVLEWGIANETDQYMFRIYKGELSIIRRSTVELSKSVLIRNGLDPDKIKSVKIGDEDAKPTVQPLLPSGDPFDVIDNQGPLRGSDNSRARQYYTIEIPRGNFNGDSLDGNGPSGYLIKPENVTMYKIEFGWYGAIGARFYAYIPSGAGEARWVAIHTLVIENSLEEPCLRDSFFRFKYSLSITDNSQLRTPQFLYKYGASYYIDGGDEGTSQLYSVNTGLSPKQITFGNERTLFGIKPKDFFESVKTTASGTDLLERIGNRKLVLPTKFNMTTNVLTEVKVKTCRACAGFGQVFTPGVKTGESGRKMEIEFTGQNLITAKGSDYFIEADIGSKLIAPSLFGVYISGVEGPDSGAYSGPTRYARAQVHGFGDGLDAYFKGGTRDSSYNREPGVTGRPIGGAKVKDYAQGGNTTTIAISTPEGVDGTYPYEVRLSNYDVHFASDFPLYGSEIDIQFMNPLKKDESSSGGSGTHFADFMIGVTDKKPSISQSNPNELDGWDDSVLPWKDYSNNRDGSVGSGLTTILPENEILFGESTHSYVTMNEDGVETGEAFSRGDFRCRMGQDVRIPSVTSTSGGNCSLLKIKVSKSITIGEDVQQEVLNGVPGDDDESGEQRYFLTVQGRFEETINDWLGGRVVYEDPSTKEPVITIATFIQRKPIDYTIQGENDTFIAAQYLEIKISDETQTVNFPFEANTNINLLGRPIELTASRLGVLKKSKLFRYDVYPLYLVGKLKDKAQINNISIKEKLGTSQKTTAPILSISKDSNGVIDLAFDGTSNNTFNDSILPTNFVEADKRSSTLVDTQNQQILRPSTIKDTFYVGENETKEIDMSKVFGVDRNVITPDNNNIEVTFFTAKQLEAGSSKFVQGSLNFKEQ